MKKYLIISIALLGFLIGSAQSTSIQVFAEETIMGLQKGYGIRYQTINGLGIGLLFQSNGKFLLETAGGKYPFYGVETIVPIAKCTNMRFFFSPKVGFVNKNFLILIPQVETEIAIAKFLSVGITTGIRARRSSAGAKVILHM